MRRDLGQRYADRFADKGHGARRARIDLEDKYIAALHGELHVHQTAHIERLGQRDGVAADFVLHFRADRFRRQTARAVAGVDAGALDMFHDAADHVIFTVAQRIDIDFDGIVEKFIDQHRMLGRSGNRMGHVILQSLAIINDLHGPAAEHIGWTHQHWIAEPFGDLERFVVGSRACRYPAV